MANPRRRNVAPIVEANISQQLIDSVIKEQSNSYTPFAKRGTLKAVLSKNKYSSKCNRITNSDKIYSIEELEFIKAMRSFIEETGKKFPTFSEILDVLKSLGYERSTVPQNKKNKNN